MTPLLASALLSLSYALASEPDVGVWSDAEWPEDLVNAVSPPAVAVDLGTVANVDPVPSAAMKISSRLGATLCAEMAPTALVIERNHDLLRELDLSDLTPASNEDLAASLMALNAASRPVWEYEALETDRCFVLVGQIAKGDQPGRPTPLLETVLTLPATQATRTTALQALADALADSTGGRVWVNDESLLYPKKCAISGGTKTAREHLFDALACAPESTKLVYMTRTTGSDWAITVKASRLRTE
jgi:hypothetical protein